MQNEVTLTNGAIAYITSLKRPEPPNNKAPISINTCLLRIEAINTKPSAKGELFALTLSDGVNKNSNFYFCRKESAIKGRKKPCRGGINVVEWGADEDIR